MPNRNAERPAHAITESRFITVDLGELTPGVESTADFEVSNDTDELWTIARVQPGCGCTNCVLHANSIPAGASVSGQIIVRPPDKDGPFAATTTIHLDDGEPQVFVRATGNVVRRLVSHPERIGVSQVPGRSEPPPVSFEIEQRGQSSGEIVLVSAPKWCRVRLASPDSVECDDGKRRMWRVDLEIEPGEATLTSRVEGDLVFALAGDATARLTVPVSFERVQSLQIHPTQCFFGRLAPGKVGTVQLLIETGGPSKGGTVAEHVMPTCRVSYEIANAVTVESRRLGPTKFLVTARFVSHEAGTFRGQLDIGVPGTELQATVPVNATVSRIVVLTD